MLKEINGDNLIVYKLFIYIIRLIRYLADVIYSFYNKLNELEKSIKEIYSEFQTYLYNKKEKEILKDLSYSKVYIYIVSRIHLTLFIDKDDLNNIRETEEVKLFKESNMLGFTSNDAFNRFIEDKKQIYIIRQKELDDYE